MNNMNINRSFSGPFAHAGSPAGSPGMANPHHNPHHSHHQPHHSHHQPQYHGFCHSCCHPVSMCCCDRRACRKEEKELLATPVTQITAKPVGNIASTVRFMTAAKSLAEDEPSEKRGSDKANATTRLSASMANLTAAGNKAGIASAFIGGGCCVHLSVEYMRKDGTSSPGASADAAVAILVSDSDNTTLAWMKVFGSEAGYQIKEDIITTKPGANLIVIVINAVARVRWCEVFSC